MKNRIYKISLILISIASIVYTVRFYSLALYQIKEGNVVGPNAFYPWFVALEGIVLLAAAAIPLFSAFRPSILNLRSVRVTGALCITFGILMSINFFVHAHGFSASHIRIALRLASWCALAFLTYWTLKNTTANKAIVDNG